MKLDGDLRSRLLFLLQREEASGDAELVWRCLALYCCRLLPRAQFRIWIHSRYKDKPALRDSLLALKEALDNGEISNRVLRAVWELAGRRCRHEHHYCACAETHHLALRDLQLLERSLTTAERKKLRGIWRHGIGPAMTDAQLQQVLQRYIPICRGLVKAKLGFVWHNDRINSFQDLCSELRVEIIRLARYYEVYITYNEERFRRCVHRGIMNKVKNMIVQHSRQSRRCIDRVYKAKLIKRMWYLSSPRLVIKRVVVSGHQDARRCKKDKLETAVLMRNGKIKWVPVSALYDSKDLAQAARFEHRRGSVPARPLPDLVGTDLDDFRLSSRSLDDPLSTDSSATLHNVLSAPQPVSGQNFLMDLSQAGASADLQAFARAVIGDCQDQLFAKWLHRHRRREIGVLTLQQLGKLAAIWVGTNMEQLKQDLVATPSTLWTVEQRQILLDVTGESGEAP